MKEETKVFEITANPQILRRIERFLALLHFNSCFGHSGLFGMGLDGDGSEKVVVKDINRSLGYEVDLIGGIGYGVEIANDTSYSGRFIDNERSSKWVTQRSGSLYKEGELVKTIPSSY